MFRYVPISLLALVLGLSQPFETKADDHFVSLKKIFPNGKCTNVIPNFVLMKAIFAGGETTEHKILDDRDRVVETITTFINKTRDQWAMVGSKTERKVIFCLYASGKGQGSINRHTIEKK